MAQKTETKTPNDAAKKYLDEEITAMERQLEAAAQQIANIQRQAQAFQARLAEAKAARQQLGVD